MWYLLFACLIPRRKRNFSLTVLFFALTITIFVLVQRFSMKGDLQLGPVYHALDFLVTKDQIGVGFCPVCFGKNESVCERISDKTVKLYNKEEKWTPRSQGESWNGKPISIKYFRNASEFLRLDNELCSRIGKINTACEVHDVVWSSFLRPLPIESAMQETMHCPSRRLVAKVKNLQDKFRGNFVEDPSRLQLVSTLHVNSEPVIFQVFPASEGWPFPIFYGACGRTIVLEDTGLPLDSFLSAPWIERAKLGLEIIQITKYLTNNPAHWGLYLADFALDMFTVANGTVKLADANNILVVDFLDSSMKAETEKTRNICQDEDHNCVSFFPYELCQGITRDHNFYAVCRSLLSSTGNRKGLLHTPPDVEDFQELLQDALTECVTSRTIRRKEAIDLILGLLQSKISEK
ncbi:divergent protein kinase domain 2A-like [Acropora palmata]|uniref:divergent protein kinase domain 2A-like n=1 Tax=Acropora palmata TaxID=6131 RepID=UPI003DA1B11B